MRVSRRVLMARLEPDALLAELAGGSEHEDRDVLDALEMARVIPRG